MFRHSLLAALTLGCPLASAVALGQTADEHDGEVIGVPAVPDTGPRPDLAKVAALITDRTNAFRKAEGRGPTMAAPKLLAAARYFADYMAKADEYGHTADGARPADRAKRHGYDYCIVLENIAYAYDSRGFAAEKLADRFVTGWQKSPGHRKNILDPDVTDIAVAIARSDKTGHYYAVQMFGRPKSAAIEFRIDNRAGVAVEYAIGDQSFTLPLRYVRTHTRCRTAELTFRWPGEGMKPAAVKPASGDRLVVSREGEEFRVKKD